MAESQPSRDELRQLFGDDDIAADVRFLDQTFSWVSLRILRALAASEPATTGELARSVNMDMREVRARLETLAELGVVERDDAGEAWHHDATTIDVHLAFDGELRLEYALDADESGDETADDERSAEPPTEATSRGLAGRVRDRLSALVGR
jgi:DNA-binding transcriptional ArsR family regulator